MSDKAESTQQSDGGKFPAALILIPLACMTGAMAGYLVPSSIKADLIAYGGWGVCLLVLVGILLQIGKIHKKALSKETLRGNWPLLLLSALMVLVYGQIDHRANKVILDELILQASAMQLLDNNEYRAPQFSHNLSNELSLHSGIPDKRPPMYPVVLSLVHRLLGYSQSNGFLLNGLLGFFALLVVGRIGQHFYPGPGGYLAILGIASLPLLSQNVTGQHLEVLYLFLIAFLFLTSLRISIKGNTTELPLAYLLAAAIALTRYEGLLFFMVPYAIHIHAAWSRREAPRFEWVYLACPIGVAYLFALVGYIFSVPGFWQLDDLQSTSAFGSQYWAQNTGALLDVFLNTTRSLPGSLALSVLGLASLPITLVHAVKAVANARKDNGEALSSAVALIALLLTMLLFLALIFSYHWGYVNSHLTARFLLFPYLVLSASILFSLKREPFWLLVIAVMLTLLSGLQAKLGDAQGLSFSYFLLLGSLAALAGFQFRARQLHRLPQLFILFWAAYLLSESFPAINQRSYEDSYLPIPRTKVFLEWVDEYAGTNSLFISNSPYYGILSEESASSLDRLRVDPRMLISLAGNNRFENIFVLQEVGRADNGDLLAYEEYQLPSNIQYETVETKRLVGDFGVRLLRISGMTLEANPEASE
jgi:hypothetical protein